MCSDLTARKDTTMEVTAYTEQVFLERLMKKQETEEKLRVGSDASKLRSAVTNIGGGSEKIKKSDRVSFVLQLGVTGMPQREYF